MKTSLWIAVSLLLAAFASSASAAPLARWTVDAGKYERMDAPVSAELPGLAPAKAFQLVETTGGARKPVAAQLTRDTPPRVAWVLDGRTAAGAKRTFELEPGGPAAPAAVTVRDDGKALEVVAGGAPVMRFNYVPIEAPKGASPLFSRGAYIHPLWSPGGTVLTTIQPPDHLHHLGLWSAWTHTEFEGRTNDHWNLKEGQGTVRFVKFAAREAGPVFGGFEALQDHVELKAPGGENTVLNEQVDVRVWNAGDAAAKRRLFDYVSRQRCATASPIKLGPYRYGGVGFRATEEWKRANSDYLTSEGKTRKDGHATRARWCIMSGTTGKGPSGLLVMSHPANREHPEPMRIWGDKDNKDGEIFFNFCPIQQKAWTMEPGQDYVLRYRYLLFDGALSKEEAEQAWRDFAEPPVVTSDQ